MKLHIGCGNKYLDGYKHLDVMYYEHIDYVANADNLCMFDNDSVEEIYACHVIEHFKRNDIARVINEWKRVLIPGGTLRLAVPDFESVVKAYLEGTPLNLLSGLLYGGQTYDYNFHFQAFDYKSLETILIDNGFCDISRYDWRDFLPQGFDDFSRAYLPHMDFSGRLMSLNVIAKKI